MQQRREVERSQPRQVRETRGSWSAETMFALFIGIGVGAWLFWLFLQWAFGQIAVWYAHHFWLANGLFLVLGLAILGPLAYYGYIRFEERRQDLLDRRVHRNLMVTVTNKLDTQNFNTEFADQVRGIAFKSINPETVRPTAHTVTNNNFLEGQEGEEQDEEEPIVQPTIEECVEATERNSYQLPIGTSLTTGEVLLINIYKKHLKVIGASQKGKSSWIAAMLDILSQTHDPNRLQMALLDKENTTCNLFAHLPHVLVYRDSPMVARSEEEVLEKMTMLSALMTQRYQLKSSERKKLPLLLIYIEEFLQLKKHFRKAIAEAKPLGKEAVNKATARYQQLIKAVDDISSEGLKVRMQLLVAAQTDYADPDLRDTWGNVPDGMSFCVKPSAAMAAGFTQTELLNENYDAGEIGQFVCEAVGVSDLVIAPYNPLEDRIVEWENEQERLEEEQAAQKPQGPYIIAANGEIRDTPPARGPYTIVPHNTQPLPEQSNAWMIEHFREHFDAEGRAALDRLISEDVANDTGEYGTEAESGLNGSPGRVLRGRNSPVNNGVSNLGEFRPGESAYSGLAEQPVERAGDSPSTHTSYPMMDEAQMAQFIALYPLHGTEKSLDQIRGCSHKHREHARVIIREQALQRRRG